MEAKHIVSDGNNTVVTCSDWPNLRGKGEDVQDQYGISQLVHSVQIDGEWPSQTVSLADDGFGPTVADLVAPYWERPAGPTWWCHVAAGHTSVQAWLNNAKWLHPAKPEREIKRNGREQQRRRKRFCHQILIYTVLSFATRRSIWCICLVSRSPSFGILRTALEELFALCFSPAGSSSIKISASHYGMLYYTWSPMYLCLLLERTWSCLPLRIACFPLRLHPKMDSPMLSHWYNVWMWTTFANFLLLCYMKGEFYFIPTISDGGYSLLTLALEAIYWNITSSMPTLHYFFSVELIIVSTPYMTGLHSSVGTPCNGWCSGCGP
ncbi:hypothetical protein OIU85_010175 [Salix viminalis]|uniref:Uncharacterized protein n=1 Tax=Salix viminalis TaxID=40686 RepID=A0A9Q0NW28_SALVM|nr:hypothetical protein OIU85_010175 [Salix viminalis]